MPVFDKPGGESWVVNGYKLVKGALGKPFAHYVGGSDGSGGDHNVRLRVSVQNFLNQRQHGNGLAYRGTVKPD